MTDQVEVDPVEAAIKAAEAAASAQPEEPTTTTTAVSTTVANTNVAPLSIDDISQGMIATDYLKVKEAGLCVGEHPTKIFQEVEVEIDVSEIYPTEVIKFGNPAVYLKTHDRVTCLTGGTWQEALEKARQVVPDARPYMSADIPMVLTEDLVVDKTTVAEAGDVLGHSTSTTNYKNLQRFLKDAKKLGDAPKVRVKITREIRTNKNNNTWGVLKFEVLGLAD